MLSFIDSKHRISTVAGKEIKEEQRKKRKIEMTCRERKLSEALTFSHCNPKNSLSTFLFCFTGLEKEGNLFSKISLDRKNEAKKHFVFYYSK